MPGLTLPEPPDADATMAARNDTIVLDASPSTNGPRVKRLKIGHASASPGTSPVAGNHAVAMLSPRSPPPFLRTPPALDPPSRHTASRVLDFNVAASPPAAEPRSEGPVLRKNKPPSLRLRLARQSEMGDASYKPPPPPPTIKPRAMDLYSAPQDPVDFVWWIARQVMQDSQTGSGLNGGTRTSPPAFNAMTGIMRPLDMNPQGFIEDPAPTDAAKEKEREKQRVDNRERKKRWRETNAERNKDNDLRCRVTKLAKAKFGEHESDEKSAFIEREFDIRRAKRAEKEKRNASYRGTISAFRPGSDAPGDLKDTLRQSLRGSNATAVEAAGAPLIEILAGVATRQLTDGTLKLAQSLQEDIASGATMQADIEEAARILAGNVELQRALEGNPRDGKDSAEPESVSGDDEDRTRGNGHLTKDTTPANGVDASESPLNLKSTDAAGNMKFTLKALNGLSRVKGARGSARSTPTPRRKGSTRAADRPKGKRKRRAGLKSNTDSRSLDTSSIDALLALANGGSIMANDDDDDDDDDEISFPDTPSLGTDDLKFLDATTDEPLNDILERVATRIVRERLDRESSATYGDRSLPKSSSIARTHAIRELVLKLKSFLSKAGVSVNTLVPATEAQKLSELYAELLTFIEREATPPYESTRMRTFGVGRPSMLSSADSQIWGTSGYGNQSGSFASTSTGAVKAGESSRVGTGVIQLDQPLPVSHRSPEEQRKIESYGFPLLPNADFQPHKRNPIVWVP